MGIPYVYIYDNKLVFAIDMEGEHYTTDRHFYEYMVMRPVTPKVVHIMNTTKELKQALRAKGVEV